MKQNRDQKLTGKSANAEKLPYDFYLNKTKNKTKKIL